MNCDVTFTIRRLYFIHLYKTKKKYKKMFVFASTRVIYICRLSHVFTWFQEDFIHKLGGEFRNFILAVNKTNYVAIYVT